VERHAVADQSSGQGVLYVVATPIGNLDDISSRARAVLAAVDVVAAEDTRRTGALLAHLGLAKPMVAFHEHSEAGRVESVLARLREGQSVALVSDAGTPLISDPGYRLVAAAREAGITVTAIPGCCAAVAALSVAGLPTDRFHFEGFLPAKAAARRERIAELASSPDSLVFYEAVHRVAGTLDDLVAGLGASRPAFVARELTKLHETVYHGALAEVAAALATDPNGDRGEFTLVIGGQARVVAGEAELERVARILAAELPAAQAAALAARLTGVTRRAAYRAVLRDKTGGMD
jgi:16S rRNA (cytidine1402-2'-O)-methyltransferase